MKTQSINLVIVERLVQAEAKRRKVLFERRSRKLLWFVGTGVILAFLFLLKCKVI